jgi:hypothetical protein
MHCFISASAFSVGAAILASETGVASALSAGDNVLQDLHPRQLKRLLTHP